MGRAIQPPLNGPDDDTVARWVGRFNRDGLAAMVPRHGGGPRIRYGDDQRRRILAEGKRTPRRERDGTAAWSLSTLRRALRCAQDGHVRPGGGKSR